MVKESGSKRDDRLNTAERKELSSSDFGLPAEREFPMPDAAHVHAAESYFRYAPEDKKSLLAHRILMKAKKCDVEVKSPVIKDWANQFKKKK